MGRTEVLKVIASLPDVQRDFLQEMFRNMPKVIFDRIQVRNIPKGEILVRENEKLTTVYFLLSGRFQAFEHRILGTEYDYINFTPVKLLGSMEALLDYDTYQTTLIASSACMVLSMEIRDFKNWIEKDTNALLLEFRSLGRCLLEQGRKERVFLFLKGQDRLIMLLLEEYKKQGTETAVIAKTRQNLSDCCGLSSRTVNRALHNMHADKMVTLEGHKIKVNSAQAERLKDYLEKIIS